MAMKDEYRHETQKSPSELEREIDLTRAHMDHTLDLLEAKLSPGELIDQVIGLARGNGGGFARNLTTQVQNNPLPALLTGVGLAWRADVELTPRIMPRALPRWHRLSVRHDAVLDQNTRSEISSSTVSGSGASGQGNPAMAMKR